MKYSSGEYFSHTHKKTTHYTIFRLTYNEQDLKKTEAILKAGLMAINANSKLS